MKTLLRIQPLNPNLLHGGSSTSSPLPLHLIDHHSYYYFDFDNNSLVNISLITLSSEPVDGNHVAAKSHVDFLLENERSRRDLSLVLNDQGNDFNDIELTNLDSLTLNRYPLIKDEVVKKC